ncbi:hypothetical protein [Rhodococcus gordoniae]
MSKKKAPSAVSVFKEFDVHAKRFESLTARTLIAAARRNQLSQRSIDALFTSAFLSLHMAFENFLEELFYSAATGASGIIDCHPLTEFASRERAELVFLSGKKYIDWMPYESNTLKLAERALENGAPFSRINRQPTEIQILKDVSALRNAIAHQSAHSLRQASRLTSTMPPRRRHVAGYLQDRTQGVTRYSTLTTDLRSIASALSAPDISTAKQYLNPEKAWSVNDSPQRGKYICVRCARSKTKRTDREKLGSCRACTTARRSQLGWRRDYRA